jgi:hypothetical protein
VKRREALVALGLGSIACAVPGPDPTPTPILPTPSPTPLPIFPGLSVSGSDFLGPGGNPIWLIGASNCDEAAEWSVYPPREPDRIFNHRGNWTHIRLGPFWSPDNEMPFATVYRGFSKGGLKKTWREYDSAYLIVDGKADLDQWNPVFWGRVSRYFEHVSAYQRPFVTEVDLLDRWILHHSEYSPWRTAHNIQGFNGGDLSVTGGPLMPRHIDYIRKCVQETGRFNVIYQTGNEGFKGYSDLFDRGIYDTVKQACWDFGYPERLVGTNTHDRRIEEWSDYITRHKEEAQHRESRPIIVNEYDEGRLPPDKWKAEARRAKDLGTMFPIWRCVASEPEYERLLDDMESLA